MQNFGKRTQSSLEMQFFVEETQNLCKQMQSSLRNAMFLSAMNNICNQMQSFLGKQNTFVRERKVARVNVKFLREGKSFVSFAKQYFPTISYCFS